MPTTILRMGLIEHMEWMRGEYHARLHDRTVPAAECPRPICQSVERVKAGFAGRPDWMDDDGLDVEQCPACGESRAHYFQDGVCLTCSWPDDWIREEAP